MKNFLVLVLLSSLTLTSAQQFSKLRGIEDQDNTILMYSLGQDSYGQFSSVYKFDVTSGVETKIIEAFSMQIDTFTFAGKSVNDYEFFPNDTSNFINVGATFGIDILGYAARNDTINFTNFLIFQVDISKQRSNQVYLSDFTTVFRSFDSGYTYPQDSTIEFRLLSVAEFDDKTFFGVDDNSNLVKSENSGTTSFIVDTSKVNTSLPYLYFYYDVDDQTIYRLNTSYNKITLHVSTENGAAFTWSKIYESEHPFFISIDTSQNGTIYLGERNTIFKSTNHGLDFSIYKTIPNSITGLYKKPNSEFLYASTKYKIYEINNDSIRIIRSTPIPEIVFEYYPLNIGNKWIFNYTSIDYLPPIPIFTTDLYSREVVDFLTLPNGKNYFKIDHKYASDDYILSYYERIDSNSGKILRYEPTLPDSEQVIDDLLGEVGDSLMVNRFEPYNTVILTTFEDIEPYNEFGITSSKRIYKYPGLLFAEYSLVHKVGLEHILLGYDFGTGIYNLKGFIKDGVVYGDTTLTDIDDITNKVPTRFELSQNYPNPFNPTTKISWQLPEASFVTLKIFNSLGEEVETLVNEFMNTGIHSKLYIVNSALPSGVYFYQLKAGSFVQTKKMILIK